MTTIVCKIHDKNRFHFGYESKMVKQHLYVYVCVRPEDEAGGGYSDLQGAVVESFLRGFQFL